MRTITSDGRMQGIERRIDEVGPKEKVVPGFGETPSPEPPTLAPEVEEAPEPEPAKPEQVELQPPEPQPAPEPEPAQAPTGPRRKI